MTTTTAAQKKPPAASPKPAAFKAAAKTAPKAALPAPVTQELFLPGRRRWTSAEFERLIDLGFFAPDERLELIAGDLIRKMTQNSHHTTAIGLVQEALRQIFQTNHHVRIQMPLTLGQQNRPEPDIAVVTGTIRDYAEAHPTNAVLVVEISDTTLATDRTIKAGVYAKAGIAEYWIVNLTDRVIEVHRQPSPMADQPLGHHYRSITRHPETEILTPLATLDVSIAIADLLP